MDPTFGILGRTVLRIAGALDDGWGPPRERALLAALLIHPGRPVPIAALIEWVWPEEKSPPQNPAPTFHTYATRIRKSLQRVAVPATLTAEDGNYRLDVDQSHIDYYRFRDLMDEARELRRQGQTRGAADRARQAINLWRGRPLEELRTERAENWRRRVLVNEWLPANTMLLETLIELAEHAAALAHVDDLLAEYPHDLGLVKVRLAALHGLARTTDMSVYYFNTRRRLLDESDTHAAEHLRQFHDSLAATQPSRPDVEPRTLGDVPIPRQLPRDVADFVGRTDLLRELDAATATPSDEPAAGVVILEGMAGVGKTALAVHWAHRARHRFPGGDFFVDLQGFAGGAQLSQARVVDDFLIALGQPLDRSLNQRARQLLLNRLLGSRRALVVLDNARDSEHVKDLTALLPSCLILVTSRQHLTKLGAATGARHVRVGPMPSAEAAELLSVRLGLRRNINHNEHARLARLCGGLPLVITMLAEHVAASGIGDLSAFAQQLDRRQLIVDIGEDGDGSAIAQSYFSWSYRRLAPAERRLFRLLGRHPTPTISLDVARACDARSPEETHRSIRVLLGAHLLERPTALDRYRFHDLLREFAAYCAERDETPQSRAAAERRMLSFYLDSAARANNILYPSRIAPTELPVESGVEPVDLTTNAEATSWFDHERTNLIAAVRMASARGHHDHAWRLADLTATYLDRHGYYDDSRTIRELAVSSANAAGHRDGETSSLEGLGMVHLILGDHSSAQHCLDRALRYAIEDENERARATTLHMMGRLAMQRGDPAAAVNLYRQCLDVALRIDDQAGQCWTHCRIAEALRILEQYDEALIHLFQAQMFAQRIKENSAHASILATIGSVYRDRGEHHAAAAHAERALRIAEEIPDLAVTVQACTTLAEIRAERGEAEAATRYAQHAVDVCQRTRNISAEAQSREVLGNIRFANGDMSGAVLAWRDAADLCERIGNAIRAATLRASIDNAPADEVDLPTARSAPRSPDQDDPITVDDSERPPSST